MRQRLVEYCEAKPVGTFLLRFLATVLSLIALIAAIIAVVDEVPVGNYVDDEEAPFGSYWRIPILLAFIWNLSQLLCLCIRGRQFPKSSWLALIEMCMFMLLIIATSVFLGLNRPHDEKQIFGWSAIEGWLGIFASFCNLALSITACQDSRYRRPDDGQGDDIELDER